METRKLEKIGGKYYETVKREIDVNEVQKNIDYMRAKKAEEIDKINAKYDIHIQMAEQMLQEYNNLT